MALTRPALAALALLVLGIAPAAHAAPPHTTAQIVVYKSAVADAPAQTRKRERDLGFSASQRYRHAIEGFAADLTARQIEKLQADPAVAQVVADRPVSVDSVPLVAGGTVPVGLRRIGALQGSAIRAPSGAAVAVIDTGVDLDNPDLNVVAGTNCIGSGLPDDGHGHGTHVAGTIGALNNGVGAVGVAPGTEIYAVQVLGSNGSGSTSNVICGLDWVAQHAQTLGIKVANMSLGGPGPVGTCASDPEHSAICSAVAAGVTVVAAAGNDGEQLASNGNGHVPAAYPEVLTVSAMADTDGLPGGLGGGCGSEPDDKATSFSNYGVTATDAAHMIAAPGGCVVSTAMGGGLLTMSGTSMASPHVAAAAALCMNEAGADGPCAGLAPASITQLLRQTAATGATPANGFGGDPLHPNGRYYGYLVRGGTPPSGSTGAAANVSETAADLAGSIDANGAPASWWFELQGGGVTLTTPTQSGSPGDDPVAVQGSATGLDSGTTYSYKLVVRADGWTVSGAQSSFTTPGTPPPPAPNTQIDSGPTPISTSSDAQIAFSAAPGEPAASFECALDGGSWVACSSPTTVANLSEIQHTFSVRAVGSGGKKDTSPATIAWVVDRTPPETRLSGAPVDPTANTDASFGISANEPGATFACRLDDEAWSACGSTVRRTGLAAGRHRFEARATDAAGLTDPTAAVYEWTVLEPVAPPRTGPVVDAPPEVTPFVSPPPVQPLPQPRLAPVGSVRLNSAQTRATITLACRGTGICGGRLELSAAGRRLGSVRVQLVAGAQKVVRIAIGRNGRNWLRARRTKAVVLSLSATSGLTHFEKSRLRLLTKPPRRA